MAGKSLSVALFLATVLTCLGAEPLPLVKLPPGKVVLVLQPHHDDHTTDYGMGGLIARFVDEGYDVYYVRASNDEKDGTRDRPENDNINHRESAAAAKVLGMKEVISLNWRNDYTAPIPLNELRAQLIFLIRKYKPDVVLGHNPWEHYQKNPDHRNVGRAMAEAYWLAGNPNVYPEHFKLGVQPHQASYLFGKARLDWGLGHTPNVAVELNESQVRRKAVAYQTHRNVYAKPVTARAYRMELARRNLVIPEWNGLDDQEAAVQMEEWHMEWISRKRGAEAGVRYAEDYYFLDEFQHLPGLKAYLGANIRTK
ncbi:MAG TPA: PIG-L deacetylase family protein [Bryobacteraceae bacterium]|jgi:LmbE family N-acetylglucosaminyl deacetylase|nr:PIG-L deacetylase family protein [Bryobacteraceae bacterium]